jgi:hypothetical protein
MRDDDYDYAEEVQEISDKLISESYEAGYNDGSDDGYIQGMQVIGCVIGVAMIVASILGGFFFKVIVR